MLNEEEYEAVVSRRLNHGSLKEQLAPVLAEYERITGMHETNPNAIQHHRLSLYGPPCGYCGKPLRTPHAEFCGNCMKPVRQQSGPKLR
jgi:hypothetical protein